VATQLNVIASNDSSFPSVGRAILTAEAIKEKMNKAVVATRSTARLTSRLVGWSFTIGQFNSSDENFSRGLFTDSVALALSIGPVVLPQLDANRHDLVVSRVIAGLLIQTDLVTRAGVSMYLQSG